MPISSSALLSDRRLMSEDSANFFPLAAGPHPRRVLPMMPRSGVTGLRSAWPQALVLLFLLLPLFTAPDARAEQQAPTAIPQTKFASGQDVVPYFEGWIRNKDGSFDLVFGYFNRNWEQELVIPAGPDNLVEPGA